MIFLETFDMRESERFVSKIWSDHLGALNILREQDLQDEANLFEKFVKGVASIIF